MLNTLKTNSLRTSSFKTTTAFRQGDIISRSSQYLFQRPISYEVKKIYSSNDRHEDLELIELKNDKKESQDIISYCQESKDTFEKNLKPYRLYMCVDKASASKGYIEPGHIAIYLTDRDSKIINDSFVSLRNDPENEIKNKKLETHV
jgi:hypothetical protein